jgi:CysZ protein
MPEQEKAKEQPARPVWTGLTQRVQSSEVVARGRSQAADLANLGRSQAADLASRGRAHLADRSGQAADLASRGRSQAADLARRGARATAGRTVSTARNFAGGIACFGHGLRLFLTSPVLWLLALIPVVAVHLAAGALERGVEVLVDLLLDWFGGFLGHLPRVLGWLVRTSIRWGATTMAGAVIAFIALPLTVIFGAVAYVFAVRRVEHVLGGDPAARRPPRWYRASALAMWHTTLILLVVNLGWLLILPLIAIPGVGWIGATVLVLLFDAFFVAVQALAIPLHHRGLRGLRTYTRYCWRNRASAMGFGLVSALVLMVPWPPLRWLTVPAIFIGAALLYRRIEGLPIRRQRGGAASRDRHVGFPQVGVEIGAGPVLGGPGTQYEHVAQEPQPRQQPDPYP